MNSALNSAYFNRLKEGTGIGYLLARENSRALADTLTHYKGGYGSTMGGNSLACAAGIAVLDFLSDLKNMTQIRLSGSYLGEQLRELKQASEYVLDFRCFGLMCGIDVDERGTRQV